MAFIRTVKKPTQKGDLFPMSMFYLGIIQGNHITMGQAAFRILLQSGKPAKGELKPLKRLRKKPAKSTLGDFLPQQMP